jgi:hypothetical protein
MLLLVIKLNGIFFSLNYFKDTTNFDEQFTKGFLNLLHSFYVSVWNICACAVGCVVS